MRLIAISCVRDEIDIIEPFVRHTLCFAERLVVLDNGSTDGTLRVLESLRAEGLPLEIVQDPGPGKYLSKRLTRLMHDVAIGKYKADWVLPLDADEFVVVPAGGAVVAADAREDSPVALPWRSYVPCTADDAWELNPVLRIRHHLVRENWPWIKVVIPAKLAAGTDARIEQGSHGVVTDGRAHEPVHDGRAFLGHFPIRGAGQFLAKIVVGYLQNQAMTDASASWGWHQREQFQLLKADPSVFFARFQDVACRYSVPPGVPAARDLVDDPLSYRGGPLRHTPVMDEERRGWLPILNYAEDLSRRYAFLRVSVTDGERDARDREAEAFADLRAQLHVRDQLLMTEQARAKEQEERRQAAEARLSAILAPGAEESDGTARPASTAFRRLQDAEERLRALEASHQADLRRLECSLRNSWSWRVGRVVTLPGRWLKARLTVRPAA